MLSGGKMSIRVQTELEVHRIGTEYGCELAAALVLASSRDRVDRTLKRQMAQIVLNQIEAAVQELENAAVPADLVQIYQHGARNGVREELCKSGVIVAQRRTRQALPAMSLVVARNSPPDARENRPSNV
jgi:hypothetical protein